MPTLLPSSYSFSTDKLIHFNDYNNSCIMILIMMFCVLFMMGFIGIDIIGRCCEQEKDYHEYMTSKQRVLNFVEGCFFALVLLFCFINIPSMIKEVNGAEYVRQDFRYPIINSNLVVKCTNNSIHANSSTIPQYVSDHKSYPYKLYAKQDNSKYYLGIMKNNNFEPGTTYAAGLFFKYMKYVNSHHLENKFKQGFYFKQSGKYLNGNKAQWILTNNHDINLHLVDNTIVKESRMSTN